MSYFAIIFLLAIGVAALAGWIASGRRRDGVIGTELRYRPDRNTRDIRS